MRECERERVIGRERQRERQRDRDREREREREREDEASVDERVRGWRKQKK